MARDRWVLAVVVVAGVLGLCAPSVGAQVPELPPVTEPPPEGEPTQRYGVFVCLGAEDGEQQVLGYELTMYEEDGDSITGTVVEALPEPEWVVVQADLSPDCEPV